MYVCMYVCIFIKLHMTAQSGPVIRVIGDDDNGNENRIGQGGREAKKRKKPQNSCRRHAGNGGGHRWKAKKM